MKASIVDLRYKMRDILKALERKEEVKIMYYGKEKGIIIPTKHKTVMKVNRHPFFGSLQGENAAQTVGEMMQNLRGKRYHGF